MNHRVIGIMTLYNPGNKNIITIRQLLLQVDYLIICDNSNKNNRPIIPKSSKIRYYWFQRNLGLSSAFNFVLKDKNNSWKENDIIIFFDQDTEIPINHVVNLKKEYFHILNQGINIGALGPVYYDVNLKNTRIPKIKKYINQKTMIVGHIITTSMLCEYKTLKKIHFWNEKIFLDWADFDICWRLIAAGYFICMTDVSIVQHTLGEKNKKIGALNINVEKDFREYYQIRDGLKLLGERYTPFKFRVIIFLRITIYSLIHVMFLDSKLNRMKYIFRGYFDFLRKKTGVIGVI